MPQSTRALFSYIGYPMVLYNIMCAYHVPVCSVSHVAESDTVVSPSVENSGPLNVVMRLRFIGTSVMAADSH